MSTLYQLFKVAENASLEEITKAYHQILEKADSLPQNEKIIEQTRKIKIAYDILSNPEKRKKYDADIASERANQLLKNIQVKNEEPKITLSNQSTTDLSKSETAKVQPKPNEIRIKQEIMTQINDITNAYHETILQNKKAEEFAQKQQKRERQKEKRRQRKEEQLKQEMKIQAYGKYLEGQGYKVKYPWTWLRIKRLLIAILSLAISLIILWHIPFVHDTLIDLYNENFVIKFLVNTTQSIFTGIMEAIKSIFNQSK